MSITGRTILAGVLVLVAALLCGCGRGGSEVIPVTGTITFGGGPWPKPGVVYFTLDPSASTGRPAMGMFDTDGKLTVTTLRKGDGLMPGRYKLGIECWDVPPRMGSPTPPVSFVPKRYQSAATSGMTVLVEPGQRVVRLSLDVARQ